MEPHELYVTRASSRFGRVECAPSGVALLCELSFDVQPVLLALVLQLRRLQVGVRGRADGAVEDPRRDEG